MYKTLRGESLRRVLPRILVCAALAVVLLGLSCGGLIKLAAGPKPLTADSRQGDYVSFDASDIVVAFATLSVNNADSGSKVLETYYLLSLGEDRYMAVMDRRENHGSVISRAMEQSHDYYLGDLETRMKLGTLSGTIVEPEEDMLHYMTDCIDNYQLPGYEEGRDSSRLIVYNQVNLDQVGWLQKPIVLLLGGIGLAFLLLALAQLAVVLSGLYQKEVRDLIGEEAGAGFEDAVSIDRVRVGKYVWYSKGPGSRALETKDLVWGYAMPEPMVVSKYRWPVALYDRNQELTRINFLEQKHCQQFLDAIETQGHPFRKGYTSDLAQQFAEDFEGFLADLPCKE